MQKTPRNVNILEAVLFMAHEDYKWRLSHHRNVQMASAHIYARPLDETEADTTAPRARISCSEPALAAHTFVRPSPPLCVCVWVSPLLFMSAIDFPITSRVSLCHLIKGLWICKSFFFFFNHKLWKLKL